VCRHLAHQDGIVVRAGIHSPASRERLHGLPVTPVLVDVRDPDQMAAALSGCQAVVHCAVGDWRTVVEGTRTLMDQARRQGVRRIVAISSIAVHGTVGGRLTEATPLVSGRRDYAGAKAEAERQFTTLGKAPGAPAVTLLRPTIIIGPGSTLWVDRMATRIRAGAWGTFGRLGEGTCNAVDVDDVARAVLAALTADLPHGEALTINGPERPTWNAYFEALAAHLTAQLGAPSLPAPSLPALSPTEVRRRALLALPFKALGRVLPPLRQHPLAALSPTRDELRLFGLRVDYPTDKAEARLGWRPETGFDAMIERACRPLLAPAPAVTAPPGPPSRLWSPGP